MKQFSLDFSNIDFTENILLMRRFVAILCIISIAITTLCQAQSQIRGIVLNEAESPLDFASIEILSVVDSAFVHGMITDSLGTFESEAIPEGRYLLQISRLGYRKLLMQIESGNPDNARPTYVLKSDVENLDVITVSARRPMIEQKSDHIVVTIPKSIAQGNSLVEILDKTPGILFNPQAESLALLGKENVLIYIDGRPQHLQSAAIFALLRSMQPGIVARIEVYTNPPARFDASGDAGIINIVTKSGQIGDLIAIRSFAEYGRTFRHGTTINYNIQNARIKFYGNYDYSDRRNLRLVQLDRKIKDGSQTTLLQQFAKRKTFPINHMVQAGITYDLKSNTSASVHFKYFDQGSYLDLIDTTFILHGSALDSKITLSNEDTRRPNRILLNAGLIHRFRKEGKTISFDFDYGSTTIEQASTFESDFLTDALVRTGGRELFNRQFSDLAIYATRLNYTQSFDNSFKIDVGLNISYSPFSYVNDFYEVNNAGLEIDDSFTSKLVSEEAIAAAYFNANGKIFGFETQFGLRFEHTNAPISTNQGNQVVRYGSLFPSLFLSRLIKDDHQLNLTYGRRIVRPGHIDRSPYRRLISFYTHIAGNPNVLPQFTDNLGLRYRYTPRDWSFNIDYSHTDNLLTYIPMQDDATRIELVQRGNLDRRDLWSFTISSPLKIVPNGTGRINIDGLHTSYGGVQVDPLTPNRRWSLNLNVSQSMELSEMLDLNLTFQYYSKAFYGFIIGEARWQANLGLSLDVLNDRGSIQIGLDDIFNQNRFIANQIYYNIDAFYDNRWESRMVRTSFSYRFGRSDQASLRPQRSNIEKLNNRL